MSSFNKNDDIRQLDHTELEEVFALYKELLGPYIEESFGWVDAFQKQRFAESYKLEDLFWYVHENEKKALICRNVLDDAYHIHLLLIPKKHQNKGIGKAVMKVLQTQAFHEKKDLILSTFKSNKKAVSFYNSLGFSVVDEDNYFFSMKLFHNNSWKEKGIKF